MRPIPLTHSPANTATRPTRERCRPLVAAADPRLSMLARAKADMALPHLVHCRLMLRTSTATGKCFKLEALSLAAPLCPA